VKTKPEKLLSIEQARAYSKKLIAKRNNEFDVDFIGGMEPLTKEEEKQISGFIKASKERKQKQKIRKARKQKTEV
jgi:hypothetical protein